MKQNYGRLSGQTNSRRKIKGTIIQQRTGRKNPTISQQRSGGATRRSIGTIKQQQKRAPSQVYVQERRRVAAINRELANFNKELTYENYSSKYNKLSPAAKKYIKSPNQIYATPQYQKYQKQVQQRNLMAEENAAWKRVVKADKKGMLWAHAMYGSGTVKRFARQIIQDRKKRGIRQRTTVNLKDGSKYSTIPRLNTFVSKIQTLPEIQLTKPATVKIDTSLSQFYPSNQTNKTSIFGRGYFK